MVNSRGTHVCNKVAFSGIPGSDFPCPAIALAICILVHCYISRETYTDGMLIAKSFQFAFLLQKKERTQFLLAEAFSLKPCGIYTESVSRVSNLNRGVTKKGFVKGRFWQMCLYPPVGIEVHPPRAFALFKGKITCGRIL